MNAPCLALFIVCVVLAVSPSGRGADAPKEKTSVGATKTAQPREILNSLAGSWEGMCTTWLEGDKPADESKIKGEFRGLLDGRLMRHTYESAMMGKPRQGEETIAWNSITKRFQISWLDGFHTRTTLLFSEGDASEKGFTVKGKWETGPNAAAWGWNTVFEMADDDHLTITAYVIKPDGQQKKAIETKYTRVKK